MTKLTAVIAVADVPNKNNRVYSKDTLEKAAVEFNTQPRFGQLGIPEGFEGTISMEEVSHEITNLRFNEKGELIADVRILDTQKGKLLEDLYNTPPSMGFAIAGFGNIVKREDGVTEVIDFTMTSVNAVSDPA